MMGEDCRRCIQAGRARYPLGASLAKVAIILSRRIEENTGLLGTDDRILLFRTRRALFLDDIGLFLDDIGLSVVTRVVL